MRAAWEPLRGADAGPAPAPRQAGGLDDAQAQALQRAAWLRAMEKSQVAGWLDHALLPGAGAAAGVPSAAPQLFGAAHHDLRPPYAAPAADADGGVRADARTPSAGAPGGRSSAATADRSSAVDGAADAVRPPAAARGASGAADTADTADTAGRAGAGRDAAATGAGMGAARLTPASPAASSMAPAAMASNGPGSPGALLAAMSAAVREAAPALGIDVAAASLSVGAAPPPGPGWAGALPGASWAEPASETAEAAEAPGAAPALAEADAGDQAALRLHAEWLEHGVRVWIGADRRLDLDAAGLTRLSEQLQQYCRLQGAPLLALVCNGKRVALDGAGRDGAAPNVDAGEHSDQPDRVGDGAARPLAPPDSAVSPPYTHQEQS